jgi:hypothetical protein
MEKIREGDCRMSLSSEDWEAKLPPLQPNPEFPGLGQPQYENASDALRKLQLRQGHEAEEAKQLS